MTAIGKISDEAKMVWSIADDGMKAALRTAYQTVQAAVVIVLFGVLSAVAAWVSGANINMLDVIATGRAAIGAALLSAIASLRAYYMNRHGKGARYL